MNTCPIGYYSEFDTDITVFDMDNNQLAYKDEGCPDWRSYLSQTWSKGTYIIILDDYSGSGIGIYYLEFICVGYTHTPTSLNNHLQHMYLHQQHLYQQRLQPWHQPQIQPLYRP